MVESVFSVFFAISCLGFVYDFVLVFSQSKFFLIDIFKMAFFMHPSVFCRNHFRGLFVGFSGIVTAKNFFHLTNG